MSREERLLELENELASLPKGNISTKNIRGKARLYLQWNENGIQKNKYIKKADQERLLEQVTRRQELEREYALLVKMPEVSWGRYSEFFTNIRTGTELDEGCNNVKKLKKRDCFIRLKKYLEDTTPGRVCLVYGLRRTGKTTMLFQAINDLPKEKTAYIKIMSSDNMDRLNKDLRLLANKGIKYVFIDEITLMKDFIEAASLLSDVYAMFGMKLVLSGTDSLGFAIAAQEELYNRCLTIHTTFISFGEYSRLLNIHNLDEYIRYGGTLRAGELSFKEEELIDEAVSFKDEESTRRYIDTAIAKNIQHSLACYQAGGHFRHLIDLYENNELTNAINRIIEDMNHRFLVSVITRDFKSHDLGSLNQLERKQAAIEGRDNVLDQIDKNAITSQLMELLDIRNRDSLFVDITPDHVREIKEYLKLLDLIIDFPAETLGETASADNVIFTQPGMRYCQAQALVYALMQDNAFKAYDINRRQAICNRLLTEVRGRMLEEIVLLETLKAASQNIKVFKLYFAIGEFDMVIFDRNTLSCKIYEIKHSDTITEHQYRHLINVEKNKFTEFEYGKITERVVLYQGPNREVGEIHYRNVVEYLEGLRKKEQDD